MGTVGEVKDGLHENSPGSRKALLPVTTKQGRPPYAPIRQSGTETEVIRLGDPSYISEIRMQLAERRKLLGLHAPGEKGHTGRYVVRLVPYRERGCWMKRNNKAANEAISAP